MLSDLKMENLKAYLAEQVVSEEKIVTYRALSRAMKINVNAAKQVLYDFHTLQNKKSPGSVHATYVIYGTKQASVPNGHRQPNEDVEMTSSPLEPLPEDDDVPLVTLSIVDEGNLADVLSKYESVTSIHVYSLGPHPVKDLQLLADVSRPSTGAPSTDAVESLRPIRNPFVRRRERRVAVPQKAAPKPAAPKTAGPKPVTPKDVPPKPVEPKPKLALKEDEESRTDQKSSSKESTPVPSGSKKAIPKRGASGGIMQSFAKAASKPRKTTATQPEMPKTDDEVTMQALSDDGEDDSAPMPKAKGESDSVRKTRAERSEALRRMMDESSEDEEPETEDTPMEEPEDEPSLPEAEKQEAEPAEIMSNTADGRRRGKRRVMKKKTVMDEQGYLVTVQEAGWESFSEDEPAAPPKKKVEAAAQPARPKKPAPKGQGNIMSFFSKK